MLSIVLGAVAAVAAAGSSTECYGYGFNTNGGKSWIEVGAGAVWHEAASFTAQVTIDSAAPSQGVLMENSGFTLQTLVEDDEYMVEFILHRVAGDFTLRAPLGLEAYTPIAAWFDGSRSVAALMVFGQVMQEVGFNASPALAYDSVSPLVIGRGFDGTIDEVAFFNVPRLFAEIDPFNGLEGNDEGLRVYYPFSSETESFVLDVTRFNHNGRIVGSPDFDRNCMVEGECTDAFHCLYSARRDLPDMVLLEERLQNSMTADTRIFSEDSCALNEMCVGGSGERRLLRFDTATANNGNVDLALGRPTDADNDIDFVYDPCHRHYHVPYAVYDVYSASGEYVTRGQKQAWCLLDSGRYNDYSGDGEVSRFPQYGCSNQGISTGWMDVYSSGIDCQWIDVTDLPAGDYLLKITVNAERRMRELAYNDNIKWVPFTLSGPGSNCAEGKSYYTGESERINIREFMREWGPLSDIIEVTHSDDSNVRVDLPFEFPFFCGTQARVYFASNGFLSFVPSDAYTNGPRVLENSISVFHDDLIPGDGVAGYKFNDDNTAAAFIWRDYRPFGSNAPEDLTFGAILHADGKVEFMYGDTVLADSAHSKGASATAGMRQVGENEILISYNEPSLRSRTRIEFEYDVPNDVQPTAVPGGPYSGIAGIPIEVDGTASFDKDGDEIVEYLWTPGDGAPPVLGPVVEFTYRKPGVYEGRLQVNDGLRYSEYASFEVTVGPNVPPTVELVTMPKGDVEVNEPVQFSATGTDTEKQPLAFIWDWGDGSFDLETYENDATHAYASPGSYEVSLVSFDGLHASDQILFTVTVVEAAGGDDDDDDDDDDDK